MLLCKNESFTTLTIVCTHTIYFRSRFEVAVSIEKYFDDKPFLILLTKHPCISSPKSINLRYEIFHMSS